MCTFGEITVDEQTYRSKEGGKLCRPFQRSAGISCRAYSTRLQRVITDFGADLPFARVSEKVQEHYGITIASGSAATITEQHARRMTDAEMTPDIHVSISARSSLRWRKTGADTQQQSKASRPLCLNRVQTIQAGTKLSRYFSNKAKRSIRRLA